MIVLAILGGVAAALVTVGAVIVIYRAMSTVLDWLIYTFGNEGAVRELHKRRSVGPD